MVSSGNYYRASSTQVKTCLWSTKASFMPSTHSPSLNPAQLFLTPHFLFVCFWNVCMNRCLWTLWYLASFTQHDVCETDPCCFSPLMPCICVYPGSSLYFALRDIGFFCFGCSKSEYSGTRFSEHLRTVCWVMGPDHDWMRVPWICKLLYQVISDPALTYYGIKADRKAK